MILKSNAEELAMMAQEIGAAVITGTGSYGLLKWGGMS